MDNSFLAKIWPEFESLFLDHYVTNFWSIADIDLPYGRVMMIDPRDMPSMLWRADLSKTGSYDQVLSDLNEIESQQNIPVGFAFSSTWNGDIDGFKEYIRTKGFQRKSGFHRLIKDIRNYDSAVFKSGYTIEKTDDPQLMEHMMTIGFDKGTSEIFTNGALRNLNDPTRGYFIARDSQTQNIIGCSAVAFHNNLAYMSCLAVDPEFRRQGIAKDLVRARIQFLKKKKVDFITTSVFEKNEKSMSIQLKAGYELAMTDEYWMKP